MLRSTIHLIEIAVLFDIVVGFVLWPIVVLFWWRLTLTRSICFLLNYLLVFWLVTLVEHDELFFLLCLGDVVLAGKRMLCIINLSAGDFYFQ